MYCTQCGAKNTEESNFCRKCGVRLRVPRPSLDFAEEMDSLPVDEEKVSRLLDRAFGLYDSGSLDQSFEVCRAALRLNPDSATGHSLLATIYEKQGHIEAAMRQMERVVELNPESTADQNRLDLMRRRARLLTEPDGIEPTPPSIRQAVLNNPVVLAASSIGVILIAVWLLVSQEEQKSPAAIPAPPEVAARQDNTELPVDQRATTVSGSVFDGLGVVGSRIEPDSAIDRSVSEERESHPALPDPIAVKGVSSTPASPKPSVVVPPPPTPVRVVEAPKMLLTQSPPKPKPSAPVESRLTGSDYQRLAMDAKRKGDQAAAIDNFQKAIAAFTNDLDRDRSNFEAKQGVRSCRLELDLLHQAE